MISYCFGNVNIDKDVHCVFSQEEYVSEGLEWSFVKYQDNQSCLDLLEGGPTSVFSLLNEVRAFS